MTKNDSVKKYRKLNPWMVALANAKERCNNPNNPRFKDYMGKNIKFNLTNQQGHFLWLRDKAYLMKQPSLDRIFVTRNYTFENCQFIEMDKNRIKDRLKPIIQYDLQMNFIREWPSLISVKENGYNPSNICVVLKLKGYSKTAYGYIWKYRYE